VSTREMLRHAPRPRGVVTAIKQIVPPSRPESDRVLRLAAPPTAPVGTFADQTS
jgi:hypothetical protein